MAPSPVLYLVERATPEVFDSALFCDKALRQKGKNSACIDVSSFS